MLNWLATSGDWALNIQDALRRYPDMRLSVNQVVEKGYLDELFARNAPLSAALHFDGRNIVVEDPQFVFFIRNMPWTRFVKDLRV